jgi:glycosyltransferase involved in cell wall biosynthesis
MTPAAGAESGVVPPAITVAICTYNRCATLEGALASLLAVRMPGHGSMEILVVDNNSTDGTRALVERLAARHPGTVRYVLEPKQGISHARNAAIASARAAILAFVDDDVLFHADWLSAVLEALAAAPDAACLAGRAVPVFADGEPPWLTPFLASVYGATALGDEPKVLRFPEHPYGLNMAFRRRVFEALGGFNPALNRGRTNLISGDETELFARADRAGLKTVYTPRAVVFHRIPPARATRSWAVRRYYWAGVSRAIMHRGLDRLSRRESARRAYYELAHLLGAIARRPWSFLRAVGARDGDAVETLARAAQRVGACRAYLHWPRAPDAPRGSTARPSAP